MIHMYRLIMPRPTFATDMTAAEGAIMERHFGYWAALVSEGNVLVYGPVPEPLPVGTWGLAVIDAPSADDVEALGRADPAVSSGMARFEVRSMPDAIARPPGPTG